jgi:prepilin-type N-terminal cleavage/methylation domain-containing protein
MAKNRNGFTLVELAIVIAVIAILSAVSIVAYAKIQADSRDGARLAKVQIITTALEKYYGDNGEYPSCTAMTQSGALVSSNVLVGIDTDALLVPNSAAGVTNSITCTALSGSVDAFAYVGGGSPACTGAQACLSYTLQYRQESTGIVVSVESFHK